MNSADTPPAAGAASSGDGVGEQHGGQALPTADGGSHLRRRRVAISGSSEPEGMYNRGIAATGTNGQAPPAHGAACALGRVVVNGSSDLTRISLYAARPRRTAGGSGSARWKLSVEQGDYEDGLGSPKGYSKDEKGQVRGPGGAPASPRTSCPLWSRNSLMAPRQHIVEGHTILHGVALILR